MGDTDDTDKMFMNLSLILLECSQHMQDITYMNGMKDLSEIREKFNENKMENICKCKLYSNMFCKFDIRTFINCKNIQYTLIKFPILRNLLIINALPQNMEYIAAQFFKSNIQFEILGIYNKFTSVEKFTYTDTLHLLVDLLKNMDDKLSKMVISITIYDYMIKNSQFLTISSVFLHTMYTKLDDLIREENDERGMNYIELFKTLYNLDDNIYRIFRTKLTPFHKNRDLYISGEILPEQPVQPIQPEQPVQPEQQIEQVEQVEPSDLYRSFHITRRDRRLLRLLEHAQYEQDNPFRSVRNHQTTHRDRRLLRQQQQAQAELGEQTGTSVQISSVQ